MKKLFVFACILVLSFVSCSKDDDGPSAIKGIVQFKAYTLPGGIEYAIYENNQIKFTVQLQLSGSRQNVDIDIDYHLLDGSTKIGEGKVKVNDNLDGGLGIFWGADEHAATVNGTALSGKTITVFIDPSHKHTSDDLTSEIHVNLYKKATVTIP